MKKLDILKESNMDLLCQLGIEFLKNLERIGIDIITVSDAELKRTFTKMIEDHKANQELEKKRKKEEKDLAKKNSKK